MSKINPTLDTSHLLFMLKIKSLAVLTQVLTLYLLGLFFVACDESSTSIKQPKSTTPKLIKTIGDPNYGNVYCMIQDRAGNLWFGTTENGLYRYNGKTFRQFLKADGLNSHDISALYEDHAGKIWIGTKAGICIYDPKTSVDTGGKIFQNISIPLPQHHPKNKNPYYSNSHKVYQILQSKSGTMWLATIDGVFSYDGQSFKLLPLKEMPNGFLCDNDRAERIFEDRQGQLWLGSRTNEGSYRYDGKSVSQLTLGMLEQLGGPQPKPTSWGWPQMQDSRGNLWFSNWGGAYRYDGKKVTSFTRKDGLPGIVTVIKEDSKGNIWLGGEGLTRYDGTSFKHFSTKHGLLQPRVWSILEDKTGNLWVGTWGTGLYQFDGSTFTRYSEYKK